MPLLQTFRKIVRPSLKAWLLALPLLLAGCAYDGGYGAAYYRDDPYSYSCLDCRPGYGPNWYGRHPYGHYWHGPSGHAGAGHFPGHGGGMGGHGGR